MVVVVVWIKRRPCLLRQPLRRQTLRLGAKPQGVPRHPSRIHHRGVVLSLLGLERHPRHLGVAARLVVGGLGGDAAGLGELQLKPSVSGAKLDLKFTHTRNQLPFQLSTI